MKILCAEYNRLAEVAVVSVGDDVLLRNNDDFYIPDFTQQISCVPQLVVRICKLGKSVGERFADRYFDEIGVGVRFYADTLESELKKKELPEVVAASFNGCAAISSMVKIEKGMEACYEMKVNGEPVISGNKACLPLSIEKLVALSSEFHTLKIGDFLFCGHPLRYRMLKAGDRIQVALDKEQMLDFGIK